MAVWRKREICAWISENDVEGYGFRLFRSRLEVVLGSPEPLCVRKRKLHER